MSIGRVFIGRSGAIIGSLLAMLPSTYAIAQRNASQDAQTPAVQDAETDGPEILVTAQRRSQTIIDVPFNISSVGGDALQDRGISNISGLVRSVPGVTFTDRGVRGNGANNALIIRGLNATSTGQGVDISTLVADTVSTYLGETPLFFNVKLRDIDRVEVLRGPQGTLYGSGSLGGTIRFIPNKPKLGVSSISAAAGFDQTKGSGGISYDVESAANIPLGDKAAVRIVGGYERDAGFIDSPNLYALDANGRPIDATATAFGSAALNPQKDIDRATVLNARFAVGIEPTEHIRLDLAYTYQRDRSGGQSAITRPTAGVGARYQLANILGEPSKRNVNILSADLSWDFGMATLSANLSRYTNNASSVADFSGFYETSQPAFYPLTTRFLFRGDIDTRNKGFVQELRIASNEPALGFNYVFGLYGLKQNYSYIENDTAPEIPDQELGPGSGATDNVFFIARSYEFKDFAVFGELTYPFSDRFEATVGARYFDQTFETDQTTEFRFLRDSGIFFGAPFADDEVSIMVPTVTQKKKDVIFKGNLSYKFNDDTRLYTTFSQGFRRGGSNGVPTIGPFAEDPVLLNFQPDRVNNYEIGLKGRMSGLRYTVALFYVDWKNVQLFTLAPNGSGDVAINGGKARSKGIEIQTEFKPVRFLDIELGYAYTDAALSNDFNVASIIGVKGAPLPGTSRHNISFNIAYKQPVSSEWDVSIQMSGNYRSRFNTAIDPVSPEFARLRGFLLAGASVGVESEQFSLDIFADNIFNTTGITTFSSPLVVGRNAASYISRPRTIGIRTSAKF
jgi:iron complex outermembrane recepter protein